MLQSTDFWYFAILKEKEENHAENIAICYSHCSVNLVELAAPSVRRTGTMNVESKTIEKILGILLAAASAALCAAIDFWLKREE